MDGRSTTARRPRVISIPVHFVQSERTQSASALKIQKVFRGFLVRTSVKRIKSIMRDAVEIEKRIESAKEVGIDEKERLRLNEALMSLLLKLDSVRGICNGVRDCRKRVIKKVVALQDKVDSINAVSDSVTVDHVAADGETKAISDSSAVASDSVADMEGQVSVEEEEEEEKTIHCMITDEDDLASVDDARVVNVNPKEEFEVRKEEGEEERGRNREYLLERMVEENEKLVGMVRELSEKSEMQTRLLNSLAQRVGMLEKTVVCDKLARMKKKKRPGPNNNQNF